MAQPDDALTAEQFAVALCLEPLPHEGGRFRRTWADEHSSAILYLLTSDGGFSAMHRLTAPEVYHFHAGAPVRMLLLDSASGEIFEPILGIDIAAGQTPQLGVPAGIWQGSATTGAFSLVGTTMAPPYTADMFTLGDRDALTTEFGAAADRIAQLTR